MQFRSMFVVLSSLALYGSVLVDASAASAEEFARRWLDTHSRSMQPNGDELGELQNENPEAYALVKALLTKRSLGLLNPRHPTASFAPANPAVDTDQPSGVAAFAKFASSSELSQAPAADATAAAVPDVYPDAPKVSHHDWLNWKPSDSAADSDDAMVQNVLGAVAQLKGGKAATLISKSRPAEGSKSASSLDEDEAMFPADAADASAAPSTPPRASLAMPAVAQSTQENSYLKNIDFSDDLPKSPSVSPTAVNDNSYLITLESNTAPKTAEPQAARKASAKRSSLSDYLR